MAKKKATRSGHSTKGTVAGILGVGLDATDGHQRMTRTPEMVIVGGSEETHGRMQETAIRFSENLEKRSKTLATATIREVHDLLRDAHEKSR